VPDATMVLALPLHRIHEGAVVAVGAPGVVGRRRITLPQGVRPGWTTTLAPRDPSEAAVELTIVELPAD